MRRRHVYGAGPRTAGQFVEAVSALGVPQRLHGWTAAHRAVFRAYLIEHALTPLHYLRAVRDTRDGHGRRRIGTQRPVEINERRGGL